MISSTIQLKSWIWIC